MWFTDVRGKEFTPMIIQVYEGDTLVLGDSTTALSYNMGTSSSDFITGHTYRIKLTYTKTDNTQGELNSNPFIILAPVPVITSPPDILFRCKTTGNTFVTGNCDNAQTFLVWTVTNANSCTASAFPETSAWTGPKPVNSPESSISTIIETLTVPRTYILTCTGPLGTRARSVTVNP